MLAAGRDTRSNVLSVRGESDIAAIDDEDHKLIAEAVNHYRPGTAHYVEVPRTGHGMTIDGTVAEVRATAQSGSGSPIYAEGLADEMGLYSTRRDRLGMRAKHLWAASRLIVEPGLHVRGWSREEAVDFMRANTAPPDVEIAVEIDRYLAMPSQSLAYMLVADRLRRASVRARAGVRSLAAVDHDVDRWIDSARWPPTR